MNHIRIWRAIARGVLLESLRRKDLWVVAILGFIMVLAAGALGFFGLAGLQAFAKDLAVTVLGIFSTIIAVLTASRILPDEIRNRTLYPLLSRPISRLDLLIGKLVGAVFATWIGFFMLALLTTVALAVFKVHFEIVMLQYLILKMMGLAVLCSVSLALSAYMTPQAAATLAFVLAFGSSMIVRALVMAYSGTTPLMGSLFRVVNALLPQFSLFDMGSRVANDGWGTAPAWVMLALLAYMLLYSSGMVALSWTKFRKQAL